MENKNLDWSVSQVWNNALEQREDRPVEPRQNLWASELGKAPIDVYLKMKGTPYTNPPNARSLRKFEAGATFEWLVGLILKRAGILQSSQDRVSVKYDGLCEVTGKIDYMGGGIVNEDTFKKELDSMELPESFYRGGVAIVEYLKEKYPDGLGTKPLEIKSLSSFMFEAVLKTGQALKIHRLQETLYLKAKGINQGLVTYICRDDMRMIDIPVFLNEQTETELKKEIEILSTYYLKDEMPPKEQPIVWDDELGKFAKNFNVAYSPYLTMLYNFQDQAEFDDIYQPQTVNWNRVLNRLKIAKAREKWLADLGLSEADIQKEKGEGKKVATIQYVMKGDEKLYVPDSIKTGYNMTDKNLAVLEEIKSAGYHPEELLTKFTGEAEEEE